jgi:microcompartment protein CcmK/EutM
MVFGKVSGSIVSTARSDEIPGAKFLLIELCNHAGKGKGDFLVALDFLGADPEELVIISQGSSCRQTEITYQKAIDALTVGIIDLVESDGTVTYRK